MNILQVAANNKDMKPTRLLGFWLSVNFLLFPSHFWSYAGKSCMYMDYKRAEGEGWQLLRDNLDASDISTACSKAQRLLLDKLWVCCSVQVRTGGNCAPFLQGQIKWFCFHSRMSANPNVLCRHDICQKFYPTVIFGAKILHKNA